MVKSCGTFTMLCLSTPSVADTYSTAAIERLVIGSGYTPLASLRPAAQPIDASFATFFGDVPRRRR
ncbi:hypothetical protein KCP73_00115 [Salmonella enterica subsp. enterica]|nr:hypothetical protein KCP73_00115 [Salmonella enterica subsp. enterica]